MISLIYFLMDEFFYKIYISWIQELFGLVIIFLKNIIVNCFKLHCFRSAKEFNIQLLITFSRIKIKLYSYLFLLCTILLKNNSISVEGIKLYIMNSSSQIVFSICSPVFFLFNSQELHCLPNAWFSLSNLFCVDKSEENFFYNGNECEGEISELH